ncbi:S1 RNA-binding domain-containing protein [Altericista sp. CCNU0014]|uniref:S1 RNA-binding domain-containing protein n=1 Tax=Altericista sp. CCNU0014 TaxID=3082949 RepID=UPI003850EE15
MSFSHDDFLKALDQHDFAFEVGQTVLGKIASYGSDGAYIDIGGKSAALLPVREVNLGADQKLEELLPLQTEREFLIVRGQDENGQITLSLRQLEIKAFWEKLQTFDPGQTLKVRVNGTNKGGLTANVKGIKAFIPRSHVVQRENIEELVGQQITVSILEVDPARKKLVLSQRQAQRAQRMTELEIGQLVSGKVADLRPFGAFVDLGGVTALLHVNNISQKYVSSVNTLLPIGTALKAVITDLDEQRGRISLSTSVLENRPGEMLDAFEAVMAEAEQRAAQHRQTVEETKLEASEEPSAPEADSSQSSAISEAPASEIPVEVPAVVELKAPNPQVH